MYVYSGRIITRRRAKGRDTVGVRQLLPVVTVDVVWGTSLTWTLCQALGKPVFCAKWVDPSVLVFGDYSPREFPSLCSGLLWSVRLGARLVVSVVTARLG